MKNGLYLLATVSLLTIMPMLAMHQGVSELSAWGNSVIMVGERLEVVPLYAAYLINKELHHNASLGNVAWINILIREYRLPVDLLDDEGKTPLHKAVEARKFFAIEALMNAGADPLIPDDRGQNVFDKATPEINAYIRNHFCNLNPSRCQHKRKNQ